MRKSRFREEQIVGLLEEARGGRPIDEICAREGISRETLKRWRAKYGTLAAPQAERLRRLEDENRELRRELAALRLDHQMVREVLAQQLATPTARREATARLRAQFPISERRACKVVAADRSSVRYRSRRREPRKLVERIRELARANPRHGYREQTKRLREEGFLVNGKRVLRLRRLLGLRATRPGDARAATNHSSPTSAFAQIEAPAAFVATGPSHGG